MPRRKIDGDEFRLSPDDGPSAMPDGRSRPRVTIPLRDDGSLDLSGMRKNSKERLTAALAVDPHTFAGYGAPGGNLEGIGGQLEPEGPITQEHVGLFLTLWEHGSRLAIPAYIKKSTKGQCSIPPEIADRAFVFSAEQRGKLCPPGAKFFNDNLPPWLKNWLSKAGPGAEFFGGLLLVTYGQTQAAIMAWRETQAPMVTVPVNGNAEPPPGFPPRVHVGIPPEEENA